MNTQRNLITKDSNTNTKEKIDETILYKKGYHSDTFTLILRGTVLVCSGSESFMVELHSFNFLGMEALLNDNYVPDFSARVVGPNTRLL